MPVHPYILTANADVRSIVAGEALTVTVELYDRVSKSDFPVYDATGASAVFPGASAPVVKASGAGVAVDPANPARLKVTLTSADTLALQQGSELTWEVHVLKADGSLRIAQISEGLDVVAALA